MIFRWVRRIIVVLISLVAIASVLLWITGNTHIFYGVGKTYFIGKTAPDIDDLPQFDVSTIHHGEPEPWPLAASFNQQSLQGIDNIYFDSLQTTAFLVFRNDSLLFENYRMGYDVNTPSNSFSMAKSFLAMMYGPAVSEGYIKSLDQPVGDFLENFREGKNAQLTIRHLLQMSSGIPYGESYSSPFGYMAKAYYGKNLEKETMKFAVEKDPGTNWVYEGGNSVLLGMILKKATGKTPSQYFEEKIWSCIGTENNAYWNLDREGGLEKTFSGFYATARDFGRIGQLYLDNGVWENDTLISPGFVTECITPNMVPDQVGENCDWYGMHWWLGEHNGSSFYSCRGLRGQYIIVLPGENLVIVRLGHLQLKERINHMPPDLLRYIEIAKQIASD
jgi:CubicO group peptidase (beta-lactamase class C family)